MSLKQLRASLRIILVATGFLMVDLFFREWPGPYEICLQILLVTGVAAAEVLKAKRER